MKRCVHILALGIAVVSVTGGCGKSRKEKQCELLAERVVNLSAGIAQELQKWSPEDERVDRETMESQMLKKLHQGDFIKRCMELDDQEVECLATAETKEQWVECGFDQQMLP